MGRKESEKGGRKQYIGGEGWGKKKEGRRAFVRKRNFRSLSKEERWRENIHGKKVVKIISKYMKEAFTKTF